MRPVSSRWAATIPASHQLSISVVVIEPDGTETDLTPTEGGVIARINGQSVEVLAGVESGSVTLDANASIRGRCSLSILGVDMVPDSAESLLAPYANEIRIERGYTTPDGFTERVALGIFGIRDSNVDGAPGDLSISISGLDRAQRLSDAKIEQAQNIEAGVAFHTAILDLLTDAWPEMPNDFTTTARVTPLLTLSEGEDRWEAAQNMAKYLGMDLYFDGDGICKLVPYAPGSPVADVVEGDGGLLLSAGRSWTRQDSFNKVIATGSNPDNDEVYRAEALDDDPASPTYYYGPFGRVPRFYDSEYIVSNAQAQDAADTILAKEIGTVQQVTFGAIVNPALEPHDVIRVTREQLGINDSLILESVTYPLSADGDMTGSCKAVTIQ